jgi:hypothetical protein
MLLAYPHNESTRALFIVPFGPQLFAWFPGPPVLKGSSMTELPISTPSLTASATAVRISGVLNCSILAFHLAISNTPSVR